MKASNNKLKSLRILIFHTIWFSSLRNVSAFLAPSRNAMIARYSCPFISNKSEIDRTFTSEVDNIVKDLHSSGFSFRIIVLSSGSILETTVALGGTTIATSKSPKTGEPIITMATTDKSFELHLKVNQISKVSFHKVKRGEEGKIMRICRMIDRTGSISTSLILQQAAEEDDRPIIWFDEMIQRYGEEIDL